ncbi:Ureidoglycolate hydrolase protein [Rutstroemia sp. NJR-2017a WRK4]|nr:Ureidoglycolate hydrolase protein [Rutstroemia sp. NJR-2017a WRK4]
MGFTTGFTGGVTLTLSLAYLTVLAHERNRQSQSLALRSQSRVLQSLLEDTPIPPPKSRQELAREERSTLIEAAKDRWNAEIENGVRWVQTKDWVKVREEVEDTVAGLLGWGLREGREGIERGERVLGEKGPEVAERVKDGVKRGATGIVPAAEKAAADAKAGAGRIAELSKEKLREAEAKGVEVKERSKAEIARRSAGGVEGARTSVREAVQRGIEKGKDIAQKASAAVGLAEQKVEGKVLMSAGAPSSDVEKALRERFEGPSNLDKSVQEALEERYRPIDQRDNSELRGV